MNRRQAALDVLRGFAVLLVLGRHVTAPDASTPGWLRRAMSVWIEGGWVGVDLFFVLSGFLVSGLLFREMRERGQVSTGRFLIRRGFKIYPAFYAMLGISLFYGWRVHALMPIQYVRSELFFVQSYFTGLWNHTWSLAVEEHFYLLLALLFAGLTRTRWVQRPSAWTVVAGYGLVAGVCLALRLRAAKLIAFDHLTHLFATHLRIDSLFFGVLLSYLHCFHEPALRRFVLRLRAPLALLSIGLFSLPFAIQLNHLHPFLYTYGFTLIAWGAGGIVLLSVYSGVLERKPLAWLARIGADSYSIYLWHMFVLTIILPRLLAATGLVIPYAVAMVVYLLLAVGLGVIAARLIELPALKLRDRYFPARAKAMVPAGSAPERVAEAAPDLVVAVKL